MKRNVVSPENRKKRINNRKKRINLHLAIVQKEPNTHICA